MINQRSEPDFWLFEDNLDVSKDGVLQPSDAAFFTFPDQTRGLTEVLPCVFYSPASGLRWARPIWPIQPPFAPQANNYYVEIGFRLLKARFDPEGRFRNALSIEKNLNDQAVYEALLLAAAVHGLRSYGPNESHLHHLVKTASSVRTIAIQTRTNSVEVGHLVTATFLKDVKGEERHYFYRAIDDEDLVRWGVKQEAIDLLASLGGEAPRLYSEEAGQEQAFLAQLIRDAEFSDFQRLQSTCPQGIFNSKRLGYVGSTIDAWPDWRFGYPFTTTHQIVPEMDQSRHGSNLISSVLGSPQAIGEVGSILIDVMFSLSESSSYLELGNDSTLDRLGDSNLDFDENQLDVIRFVLRLISIELRCANGLTATENSDLQVEETYMSGQRQSAKDLLELNRLARLLNEAAGSAELPSSGQRISAAEIFHAVSTGLAGWLWISCRIEKIPNSTLFDKAGLWLTEFDLDALAVIFIVSLLPSERRRTDGFFKLVMTEFDHRLREMSDLLEDSRLEAMDSRPSPDHLVVDIPKDYFDLDEREKLKAASDLRKRIIEAWEGETRVANDEELDRD